MRHELDCPYRDNQLLGDTDECRIAFGCNKGFDPGQIEQGDLIGDIRCWLEEEIDDETEC